jgi:hypothetical protein
MHVLGKQGKGWEGRTERKKHCAVLCSAVCSAVGRNTVQHRKEEICVAVQFLIAL